jgi:hypothetical protein
VGIISFFAWRDDQYVFVFFQLCNICYEPVIGFKEGNKDKQWFEPTEIDDLVILKQGSKIHSRVR